MAIYAVLVQSISVTDNISGAIWTCMGYTVLLCYSLFKTGSLHQPVKLLGKGFAGCSVKISKVYCRFFHGIPLSCKVLFILSYAQKVVKKEYTGQKSRQKSAALTGFCFPSQQQGDDSQENKDEAVDEDAAVRDILRLAAHGVNKGFAAVLDGELAYE